MIYTVPVQQQEKGLFLVVEGSLYLVVALVVIAQICY